ncbi:hypothetical protein PHLCEN_2v5067 [Hermanssonia centrifuga]|uniref:BRCT domain-containing protein n=1 Tax=Hermanssonia centrifuga TaxID=98765 RepID=A0A2R6PBV6_9APHY|nr:hypothetical protein PHLCEN_2v5067 [Hermanssonia centrifuga]
MYVRGRFEGLSYVLPVLTTRREEINRLVTKEGGTYVKNIERPVKVTHLLCSTGLDEISEKMKYAEKFNSRKEANISMVWEDWLWDCFSAKAATSPPSTPPLERDSAQPEDRGSSQPRQYNNSESHEHEEEELVSLKRVPAVTLQIWGGMLKHRGFEVTAGKLVRSPSKSQAPPLPAHLEKDSPTKSRPKPKPLTRDKEGSMLASFRRSHSFAPATKDTSTQRRPFGRMPTLPDAALSTSIGEEAEQGRPVASSSRPSLIAEDSSKELKSGIFSEKIFRVVGEARCQTVKLAVEEAGGKFVPEDSDESVDYVVVRLVRYGLVCLKFFRDLTIFLFDPAAASSSERRQMRRNEESIGQNAG